MDQYLSLEYQTCQQKISNAVDHLIRIELYIFIAIAAFYAWLYGAWYGDHQLAENIRLALYLPPILAGLAWFRSLMQIKYIEALAEYLRLVEGRLSADHACKGSWDYVGWETWVEKNGPKKWNRAYRFLLWPGLIAVTLAIALFRIGIA